MSLSFFYQRESSSIGHQPERREVPNDAKTIAAPYLSPSDDLAATSLLVLSCKYEEGEIGLQTKLFRGIIRLTSYIRLSNFLAPIGNKCSIKLSI